MSRVQKNGKSGLLRGHRKTEGGMIVKRGRAKAMFSGVMREIPNRTFHRDCNCKFDFQMAAKPLTSESIALAEKKINMSLDDIIKMSKTRDKKHKKQRVPNKGQKFVNNVSQDKSSKVRRFMDTRSSLRQGALAKRRTNFQGNQFPLAAEAAKKAAAAPIRSRAFSRNRQFNVNTRVEATSVRKNSSNRGGFKKAVQQTNGGPKQKPQTLDSLFANMKEERMRSVSRQSNGSGRNGGTRHVVPWARGHQYK
ncbi:Unknown protein [Striga hermonthica]|uniref:Uncharacterized protein n=1 Tax=Striga hermonthica TaxID=68872 RepID=A0A9N7NV45_STRHE|nr:Unknown protein [Striga hermonthica]